MRKRWSTEEELNLSQLFLEGVPDDVIAKKLDRTRVSILIKRKKLGITGDRNARRISGVSRSKMGGKKKTGADSPLWKGGRRVSANGYIELHLPDHHRARKNGYVFEHIVVVEKKLGRALEPGECVHHCDDDKTNNSEQNLTVMTRASHSSNHTRLRSEKIKLVCCLCGSIFYEKKSQVHRRKTCSKSCAARITLWRKIYVSE